MEEGWGKCFAEMFGEKELTTGEIEINVPLKTPQDAAATLDQLANALFHYYHDVWGNDMPEDLKNLDQIRTMTGDLNDYLNDEEGE